MDKNTVIGLSLIGVLLVVFTMWNQPTEKDIQEKQKEEQKLATEQKKEDDSLTKQASSKSDKTTAKKVAPISKTIAKGELVRLESDKLIVDLSTRGGVVADVQLKEFQTYSQFKKNDGKVTPLYLFKDGDQSNQLLFDINGKKFRTGDKAFDVVTKTKTKVVLEHEVEGGSILFTYFLKGGYDLGYAIEIKDLDGKVQPANVVLDWKMNMLRTERLISEQRKVSTICFQNADGKLDWNSEVAEKMTDAEQDINWVAYKQSYFSSILNPDRAFKAKGTRFTSLNYKDGDKDYYTHIRKYQSKLNLGLNSAKDGKMGFTWYFGPNDYYVLKAYNKDYDDILNLGWGVFRWINVYAVQPVFTFLMNQGMNAGLAILLLTIILKVVLMPVQWKMFVSSAKMRILKPQIDEINAKYPNKEDAMKKQMDMMALYRETGSSPLSGCVPMLFQMPILLAVFRFFPAEFSLRQRSFLWADDLSSFDSIWDFGTWIPLYGNHISLFTLLMAATTLIYTHLNSQNMQQQQQPGMPNMKVIMYMFPIMMIFFFNNYSSGLSYYYFISTLMTIILMFVIKQFFVDEEKLKTKMAEAQAANAGKNGGAKKKKSGFAARLEELQRQQQEQLKNRKK